MESGPQWFPRGRYPAFGPGTDSGTFDYFTEVINGKAASSRGDYTASEDDNVLVEGVASSTGGLGYFGLAYYQENADRLKIVPVKGVGQRAGGHTLQRDRLGRNLYTAFPADLHLRQ